MRGSAVVKLIDREDTYNHTHTYTHTHSHTHTAGKRPSDVMCVCVCREREREEAEERYVDKYRGRKKRLKRDNTIRSLLTLIRSILIRINQRWMQRGRKKRMYLCVYISRLYLCLCVYV
jgi:hypothetical protein